MVQWHYPEGVEAVSRGSLLKYVLTCNPKTQLNAKVGELIDAAKEKFPALGDVGNAFHSFHAIIMGDSPEALDGFLTAYGDSKFKPFCDGIKKDIAPVKNAISYAVSSGFVEGCNNKFKLIKRSLYGRSKFVNLYKKCMLAFASNDPKFTLRALLLNGAC
jgi:transposase